MKTIYLASILTFLLTGCGNYQESLQSANTKNADTNAGFTVFSEHKCATCHGIDGRTSALGISRIIVDIATVRDIENALFALKSGEADREEIMKMQASVLSTQEIIDVAAYLNSLK